MKKVRRVVRVEMTQSTEITCIVTRSDKEKWRIFLTESQKVSIFFMMTTLARLIWAFSSRLHCVKLAARLSRVPTGAAVIMRRGDNTHHSSEHRHNTRPLVPGEQGWCFAGVHLSVVLTFALSLCYWRMSNVVGCLKISNYQAICQNVGRHLNYNSSGRWHEELAY